MLEPRLRNIKPANECDIFTVIYRSQANILNVFASIKKFLNFIANNQYIPYVGGDLNIDMCLPTKFRVQLISLLDSE